jgi:DNA primase
LIAKESIEQLKNQIDIVDVISNYITLKKSGSNYSANCPFHSENSPSFMVNPAKQFYHCFGCHASGDVIKFVMEHEHASYPEAIEKIAQHYNFSLSYEKSQYSTEYDNDILESIKSLYIKNLTIQDEVLEYLKDRGVSSSSIELFEIGYAGDSISTINHLKSKKISFENAQKVGAVVAGDRGFYARFINRITFPIYNQNSKLVGFGGRTISGHSAKYINSPQSKIFNKSSIFYGFNIAKDSIYKRKEIIITEGYLDVIMLHQAGFSNVVAVLGTALTTLHMPILKKIDAKVILAFDSDSAGVNAAIKSAKLLSINSIDGEVALLESGNDPADMVKDKRVDELEKIFSTGVPLIDFVINESKKGKDISNPLKAKEIFDEVNEFIIQLDPMIQKSYIDKLSFALKLDNTHLPSPKKVNTNNQQSNSISSETDYAELNLIKSALENSRFIDTIVDTLSSRSFFYHQDEYQMLINGDFQNPKLLSILLRDDISTYSVDEFKLQLLMFQVNYYRKELRLLSIAENKDIDEKLYLIRKYQSNIKNIESIISKLKISLDSF